MSVAQLRREYRRAYKMLVLTRQEGWRRAVAKLNAEIMAALAASNATGEGDSALRARKSGLPHQPTASN